MSLERQHLQPTQASFSLLLSNTTFHRNQLARRINVGGKIYPYVDQLDDFLLLLNRILARSTAEDTSMSRVKNEQAQYVLFCKHRRQPRIAA